jgi:transposase
MALKYIVRLTPEERGMLESLVSKGKASAQKIKHANVLLKIDADADGWDDARAADAFGCAERTVFSMRQRFVEKGLEAALARKRQSAPSRPPLLDGETEARLTQIACSTPPEGRSGWTLKRLAERLVELEVVEKISAPTVCRALKKTVCNRTGESAG